MAYRRWFQTYHFQTWQVYCFNVFFSLVPTDFRKWSISKVGKSVEGSNCMKRLAGKKKKRLQPPATLTRQTEANISIKLVNCCDNKRQN